MQLIQNLLIQEGGAIYHKECQLKSSMIEGGVAACYSPKTGQKYVSYNYALSMPLLFACSMSTDQDTC